MPVELDAQLRLRHLVTGKYLAGRAQSADARGGDGGRGGGGVGGAGGDRETYLTEEYNDPNCVWRLVAYSQEERSGGACTGRWRR
eukprot:350867-Chlamydomonas_euryale.AAC.4